MNADLKKRWVEALRSGQYPQQTDGWLRTDDGFCCLGVLCDLSGAGEWEEERMQTKRGESGYPYKAGQTVGVVFLPLGLDKLVGLLYDGQHDLAEMNDTGKTFAEIADWIEANIPGDAP